MTKKYLFDDATVQITMPDGSRIAIFDVSPTIECHWIAIGIGGDAWLMEKFEGFSDMLEFVAKKELAGATVPNDDKWLDEQVGGDGFDSWDQYVCAVSNNFEEVEFPTYTDAQGNEHAEF